ncbi:ScbA/BarX family gamma-butyrolactone biosynthesis protein [Streptomyces sp. NPDC047315]|uniref:ScbA/BarX family gamma-butyrolactone biosynthesis protein n=1 Tax=Streptomyces sp. NPDC047315 TaxID=3155142 RepID=UPI0033E096BC
MAGLDFDRTVPRRLVHRRAVSEVFLCGSAQVGQDEFAVAAQLPRAHALWSDRTDGRHDPLMAVEAGRQAVILVGHAHYGLSGDLMMVARSSSMRVHDPEAFRDDGATPLEGCFLLRRTDRELSDGGPSVLALTGDFYVGSSKAMSMSGTLVCTPKDEYELLRAHSRARKTLTRSPVAARPLAAELVGRSTPRNVVIGELPDGAGRLPAGAGPGERAGRAIIADPRNPAYFDHPLDHVPGQLLLEACRQHAIEAAVGASALANPSCTVVACRVSFDDFVELDADAECSAVVHPPRADGTVRAEVEVAQAGLRVGVVELELAAPPPSHP